MRYATFGTMHVLVMQIPFFPVALCRKEGGKPLGNGDCPLNRN